MTRDDLVQRLRDEADTLTAMARRFDDTGDDDAAALARESVVGLETRIAALAAPPAAPPTDLVALVREVQHEHELMAGGPVSVRMLVLWGRLLAYPIDAAPRVPDTPVTRNPAQDLRDAGLLPSPQHTARVPDTPQGYSDTRCAACGHDAEHHGYRCMIVPCACAEWRPLAAPPQEPPR